MRIVIAFVCCAALAAAPALAGDDCCPAGGAKKAGGGTTAAAAPAAPEKASFCKIAKDPAAWNGKLVELCGTIERDGDKKGLLFRCGGGKDDPNCAAPLSVAEAPPADQIGVLFGELGHRGDHDLAVLGGQLGGFVQAGDAPAFRLALKSVEKVKAECGAEPASKKKSGCCPAAGGTN